MREERCAPPSVQEAATALAIDYRVAVRYRSSPRSAGQDVAGRGRPPAQSPADLWVHWLSQRPAAADTRHQPPRGSPTRGSPTRGFPDRPTGHPPPANPQPFSVRVFFVSFFFQGGGGLVRACSVGFLFRFPPGFLDRKVRKTNGTKLLLDAADFHRVLGIFSRRFTVFFTRFHACSFNG